VTVSLSCTGCPTITTVFWESDAPAEPQHTLFVAQNVSAEALLFCFQTAPERSVDGSFGSWIIIVFIQEVFSVKHQLGMFLQLLVLSVLPALILYQLYFGLELIVMPVCLLAGVVLFAAGTHLREN